MAAGDHSAKNDCTRLYRGIRGRADHVNARLDGLDRRPVGRCPGRILFFLWPRDDSRCPETGWPHSDRRCSGQNVHGSRSGSARRERPRIALRIESHYQACPAGTAYPGHHEEEFLSRFHGRISTGGRSKLGPDERRLSRRTAWLTAITDEGRVNRGKSLQLDPDAGDDSPACVAVTRRNPATARWRFCEAP